MYWVMVLSSGVSQESMTESSPMPASKPVGASGAGGSIIASTCSEASLLPVSFTAFTW